MVEYLILITPGVTVATIVYLLTYRKSFAISSFVLIMGFIMIRDAMTPLGLWTIGRLESNLPWMRLSDDAVNLIILGLLSIVTTIAIVQAHKKYSKYLEWGKLSWRSVLDGLIGALIVVVPFWLLYMTVPISERGGEVAGYLLLPLLFMALAGNLLEEVLFRGYLQGYLIKKLGYSLIMSAILSGLIFGLGHIFLATTVTAVGFGLILFTVYEGIICGLVRNRSGVAGSTITHGIAIFILASGLV